MFKHILVPVDGSSTSLMAVSKAAEMAKVFGSSVTAVYVVDPYPFTGVGADFAYGQAQYLSAATAEANTALEAVQKIMQEFGQPVTTVVGEGHAVHEGIVRVVENIGADRHGLAGPARPREADARQRHAARAALGAHPGDGRAHLNAVRAWKSRCHQRLFCAWAPGLQ